MWSLGLPNFRSPKSRNLGSICRASLQCFLNVFLGFSEEYPLFLPRQGGWPSAGDEGSDAVGSTPSIVNYGGASSATRESHPELQKGIKLLRRSVGCICAYGFGLLSLSAPSDMPIFDALSELLTVLSMKESRTRLVTCLKTLFSLFFFLASQFSYVFGTVNRCTNFVWSLGCTSSSDVD